MNWWGRKKTYSYLFKTFILVVLVQLGLSENLSAKIKIMPTDVDRKNQTRQSKANHKNTKSKVGKKEKKQKVRARKGGCSNPIARCTPETLQSMINVFDKAFRIKNQNKGKWNSTIASVYGVQRGTETARDIDDTDSFAYKNTAVGVCMDPNHFIAAVSKKRHDPYVASDDGAKRTPVLGSIYMVKYGEESRLIITTDVGGMVGNKGTRDFDISPRVFQSIGYETDQSLNWIWVNGGKPKDKWVPSEINERVGCVTTINNYLFEKNSPVSKELAAILDKRRIFLNSNLDYDPGMIGEPTQLAESENYMEMLRNNPANGRGGGASGNTLSAH